MAIKEIYDKFATPVFAVLAVGGLAFGAYGLTTNSHRQSAQDTKVQAVKKTNATNKKFNAEQQGKTFAGNAGVFLTQIGDGSYQDADNRWDLAHANSAFVQNLGPTLQGQTKELYKSTYDGVTSSISNINASQWGDSFLLTFDYNATQRATDNGSTATNTLTYIVIGHLDGSHWVADSVMKNQPDKNN